MASTKKSDSAFLVQGSILAVASIISRIIGLVYRIPLTAIIGKTGNDYYGTAFEIYNIILIISSYSIPLAVSKLVAGRLAAGERKNMMKVLKGSLVFAVISGGTACLIVWFCADIFTGWLKTPYAAPALRVLAPVIFIVAILGVFRGFFQGMGTMVPTAVSQVAEQITNAIVSIVAAYSLFSYGSKVGAVLGNEKQVAASYGAAGGTLGTACGAAVALLFIVFVFILFYRRYKPKIIRDHTVNYAGYGQIMKTLVFTIVPVLLSTTIYNVSSIIDQTIFKNIAVAQAYEAGTISEWWGVYTGQFKVLINVPISIASAMAASAVPTLTKAYKAGDMKLCRRQIHSATRFTMLIAFPCAFGLMALGGPIMMLLFSDPDATSKTMMTVGACSVIFFSLSTLSNGLLQGIDRLRIPVRNAAISLVAQAFFLVFLMRQFRLNIYAVIIANAFYALFMCILNGIAVRKYSGTKQDINTTYIEPLIASAVMAVAVWLIYTGLHALCHSNAISCIISILCGMLIYLLLLLVTHSVTEEELLKLPKGAALVRIIKKTGLL
ncbi:MAG: polysaccharide biosynthesis protein [Lachnospiraceae bacterium]|nr:polysaccharide biosynthesis protein [Lachnospiraceae bacterium]